MNWGLCSSEEEIGVIVTHYLIFRKILFCSRNSFLFQKQQQKVEEGHKWKNTLTVWVNDRINKSLINK